MAKPQKIKKTVVSNKKKYRDQLTNEVDMLNFKKKIKSLMIQLQEAKKQTQNKISNIDVIYTEIPDNIYQNMFQKYIKNEYTLTCVMLINKIVLDIKRNHLEQYQTKYNFNKLFVSLTKELLFNEYELILLSLYLEYIDISLYLDLFSLEDSLLFLFFFVKRLTITINELEPINSYLIKKYENFSHKFKKWLFINEKKISSKLYFNYIEINQRFKEYTSPFNVYCSDNYIDYNFIVDNILSMSLPYLDIKSNKNEESNLKNPLETNNISININNQIVTDKNKENQGNIIKILNESEISNNVNNINNMKNVNNINNTKNVNNVNKNITPNSLLHSLSNRSNIISDFNMNKNIILNNNPDNNMINPYVNINKIPIDGMSLKQQEELKVRKKGSSVLFNPMPSQNSLLLFGNSMADMPLFNRSKFLENEEENLKQMLNRSSDIFFRSSISFDSVKNNMYSGVLGSNSNFVNNNKESVFNKNKNNYNNTPFQAINPNIYNNNLNNIDNNINNNCNNNCNNLNSNIINNNSTAGFTGNNVVNKIVYDENDNLEKCDK